MSKSAWQLLWRLLLPAFAAAALAWTCALLWHGWPDLYRNLVHVSVGWLLFTLLGTALSAYLGFEAFRSLVLRVRPGVFDRPRLGHLYFTAQLLKHLPGRVWGVAYQSSVGTGVSASEWIGINAAHMLLSTTFAVGTAMVVFGFMILWPAGVAVMALGTVLYTKLWHRRPVMLVQALIHRLPGPAFSRLSDALGSFAEPDTAFKIRIAALQGTCWAIYLVAWGGYGFAWPGLGFRNGVELCALYTIAWFAGYASLVSPSGMGVRELVFVLLAHNFPTDAVAGLAILGRAMLLGVDILLGLSFAPFTKPR